ncbi:MAG: arsenate reductase ArsC [Rhodothermaceae bacterium]|nr:arsenate reductase ArsC [Rhodothermaceae bacterium]
MDTVLFVCTHNSARSQMAEGLLRARYGDRYRALSAGTAPGGVNPFAVAAMRELGIDLSGHTSDHVEAFADEALDYVVTVCDSAREACPYIPARKRNLHESFPDPSAVEGSDDEKLAAFRTVRDKIGEWIDTTFGQESPQSA